jgi:D-glycero-D-manno-heptose 1,7-bisphosphate phosphatase
MGVNGQVTSQFARAVFLDRDGVLNKAIVRDGKPYPPQSLDEFVIVPGVAERLRALKDRNFRLMVVTNQPDVARGTIPYVFVEQLNLLLVNNLPVIDEVLVCYHDDKDRCSCRKPLPGLFHQARDRFNIRLDASYMVGDRWRDIEAGSRAGCKTVFVDYGYAELAGNQVADFSCKSPVEAFDWILSKEP